MLGQLCDMMMNDGDIDDDDNEDDFKTDDDDGAVSFMWSANCAVRADSQQCFRCNGHVNHNAAGLNTKKQ